jgi:hypothetical protein
MNAFVQNQGYTIFCVVSGLPEGGVRPTQRQGHALNDSSPNHVWHKMSDLLKGKSTTIDNAKDPWHSVGSGMRLDGKSTTSSKTSVGIASVDNNKTMIQFLSTCASYRNTS